MWCSFWGSASPYWGSLLLQLRLSWGALKNQCGCPDLPWINYINPWSWASACVFSKTPWILMCSKMKFALSIILQFPTVSTQSGPSVYLKVLVKGWWRRWEFFWLHLPCAETFMALALAPWGPSALVICEPAWVPAPQQCGLPPLTGWHGGCVGVPVGATMHAAGNCTSQHAGAGPCSLLLIRFFISAFAVPKLSWVLGLKKEKCLSLCVILFNGHQMKQSHLMPSMDCVWGSWCFSSSYCNKIPCSETTNIFS